MLQRTALVQPARASRRAGGMGLCTRVVDALCKMEISSAFSPQNEKLDVIVIPVRSHCWAEHGFGVSALAAAPMWLLGVFSHLGGFGKQ